MWSICTLVAVVAIFGCEARTLDRDRRASCEKDTNMDGGMIGICFICDQKCNAELDASTKYKGTKKNDFFEALITDTNSKFADLGISFWLQRVVHETTINRGSELSGYEQNAPSGQQSTYTNGHFWTTSRKNFYKNTPYFCDVGFVVSKFSSSSGVVGAAFSSGMCTTNSFGYVRLTKNVDTQLSSIAAILNHELGHLFGMFHDKSSWPNYAGFGDCASDIETNCPGSTGLMNAAAHANVPFSTCSKKYFYFWQKQTLKSSLASTHSRSCVVKPVITTTAAPGGSGGEE